MKVVLQRVSEASVIINSKTVAAINQGMLVLLGITETDTQDDIDWLSNKIVNLRIFNDTNGVMNNSIKETNGAIILVSQFTLQASTKKGNRPSYINAAKPELAKPLYNQFIISLQNTLGKPIQTGVFGADMKVQLINDGPITILIDSKNRV